MYRLKYARLRPFAQFAACGETCEWGVLVGEELFPGFNGQSFTEKSRRTARGYGWGKAEKSGPRSMRRGAGRAILDAGGSFAGLFRAGQWNFSAYRWHLDLGIEETEAMASIII